MGFSPMIRPFHLPQKVPNALQKSGQTSRDLNGGIPSLWDKVLEAQKDGREGVRGWQLGLAHLIFWHL